MNNACMALEFTFICPLSNGFHARPASHLAGMASDFIADCALTNLRNGATANMKSVLSIIAADIRLNDKCSILIQGPDEQIARATLRHFVGKDLPAYDAPLALLQEQKSRGLPCFLRSAGVTAYFGQAVSRGIGQGKTVIIGTVGPPSREVPAKGLDRTWEEEQVKRSISAERARIENKMLEHLSATEAGILHAHLAILGDVSLLDKILEGVAQGYSAAQAVMDASRFFAGLLRQSDNPYTRERALDIQDICFQLLEDVSGPKLKSVVELKGPSVVIAENLTPQQLLALDRRWLAALVLESAGATSHSIILARSFGIPTLVGAKEVQDLSPGQEVLVDANRGFLIAECTAPVRKFYEIEARTMQKRRTSLERYALRPAVTRDGRAVEVAANESSSEELTSVFQNGADGIGLFRTEMLFFGRECIPCACLHLPSRTAVHATARDPPGCRCSGLPRLAAFSL